MSSVNCATDTFAIECAETNNKYGKIEVLLILNPIIISLALTQEIISHLIRQWIMGKEFVNEHAGGHQALLAVHLDGHNGNGNVHVHIVINSVRKYETEKKEWHQKSSDYKAGMKHRCTGKNLHYAKQWVMDKCIEQGFRQRDLFKSNERDNYWLNKRGLKTDKDFKSDKDILREQITTAVMESPNLEEMCRYLKSHFQVETRVTKSTISFKPPNRNKAIRGNKLGDDFRTEKLNIVHNCFDT